MKTPYETMFLLPTTKTEEEVDAIIGRVKETIEKHHGEVTAVEKMGVRKTAYQVGKISSALYILVKYSGGGDLIRELERMLRNSDEVMKYLSTKVTTRAAVPAKLKNKKNAEPAAVETPVAEAAQPEAAPAGLNTAAQE